MNLKTLGSMLLEACNGFNRDRGSRMAAALAYYTIFSIAPVLLIALAIASVVFGPKVAAHDTFEELRQLMGDSGAAAVQSILLSARHAMNGTLAVVVGSAILLFGASSVFAELQDDLNTIWKAPPSKKGTIRTTIKARILSFIMVLGIGFLLLLSLIASAAIASLDTFIHGALPHWNAAAQALNFVFSAAVISLLFAMIFKILPDVPIAWSDVTLGSAATAVLFSIGKHVLGLYLGRSAVTSSYGAAGTLAVILVWTYYSSIIFLFGAEFTEVYSRRRREGVKKPSAK